MAENNNPNTNINHIIDIEGLFAQVVNGYDGHLDKLNAENTKQCRCMDEARLALKSFKENELFRLRKVFE